MGQLTARGVWKRFRLRKEAGRPASDHWALRNVDFTVPAGGALGIIGSNGSGKSTLLQIVAGVLKPTVGEVTTQGRVVAILNPTAGFHPDLTGRSNIRMLASLHGFSGPEIEKKIPAIIEFSGLDDYIDQPLRAYSAGMMIRLGFSTASHLEPDLFVVDEVLSAGDLAFQRRAAGMARHLRSQGTTLLVSTHALGDLATICDRLMLLDRGEVRAEGSAEEVVASYLQRVDAEGGKIARGAPLVAGLRPTAPTGGVRIVGVTVNGHRDPDLVESGSGQPLEILIEYEAAEPVDDAVFRVQFFRNDGLFVHGQNTVRNEVDVGVLQGRGVARIRYESFGVLAGDYYVAVGIWPDEYRSYTTGEAYDHRPSAAILRLGAGRELGGGVAAIPCTWTIDKEPAAEPKAVDDAG